MANEKETLHLGMKKNTNAKSPAYGKYYPEIAVKQTLSQRGFIEHLKAHGLAYSGSVIKGVIDQIVQCLPELISRGTSVQFEGLGTFYPTIESAMGLTENQLACKTPLPERDTPGFTASELVKGVHLRFQPDDTKLDKKTSRAFKEQCQLSVDYVINLDNEEGRALIDYDSWKKGKNEPEP